MRRINLAAALVAISLVLVGCAGTQFGEFIKTATTTFNNPVSGTNIYQVKNGYAAALTVADEYRSYCWSASYRALMADPVAKRLCGNRRAVVRAFTVAGQKASIAISTAETFVAEHPTLSGVDLIGLASIAVADFRRAIPTK